MENKMTINTVKIGEVLVVSLWGDINAEGADRLRDYLKSPTPRNAKYIMFDLLETKYICSAGLRAFLEFNKFLMASKGDMKFVKPVNDVYKIFQIAGLDEVFRFYLTGSEAILEWIIPQDKKLVDI